MKKLIKEGLLKKGLIICLITLLADILTKWWAFSSLKGHVIDVIDGPLAICLC